MGDTARPRNQIGPFVTRYITPLMKSSGFTKRGSTFRRLSEQGDCAALSVQRLSSLVQEEVPFRLTLGIVPKPWWNYLRSLFTELITSPVGRIRGG